MGLLSNPPKPTIRDPFSAIYIEDTEADVISKFKRAFCPPGQVKDNPCLDYLKHIVFQKFNTFTIQRKAEHGGDK